MKKIFITIMLIFGFNLFVTIALCSETIDVSKSDEVAIYKTIQISQNQSIKDIDDAIANPSYFKEMKYFRRFFQKQNTPELFFVKLELENGSSMALKRQIFTKWDFVELKLYLVKDGEIVSTSTLKKHKKFQISDSFLIESNEKLQLYLQVKSQNRIDNFLYLFVVSEDQIFNLIQRKEMFHNGIFLGLLIAMMMYNFFMYFSMKIKSYLYLGLYQFATIVYVSDIRYFIANVLHNFGNIEHIFFKIILTIMIPILSIIFTKEFLNTKEKMPFSNKLLNAFIFIYILFQQFTVNTTSSVDYVSLLYILFIIVGFYSLKQGDKFALFYILGFVPTALFNIFVNFTRVFDLNIDIVYQNYSQILAVTEAFALSMALYLKLKQTVKEKEKAQKDVQEQEKMLLEQSRFATMGEMLASISHQWKQPLGHITAIFANLQMASATNKLTHQHLNKKTQEANEQLKYMATTIEDFNNFLSSKKELEEFCLSEVCHKAIALSKSRLTKANIQLALEIKQDGEYLSYKNGLLQVLLIVLNNAVDALSMNNIQNRYISVVIEENKIVISDNAGGIPHEILPKIFDAYFSTKYKKFGTGLGLFTAKMIVESIIKGSIVAKNSQDGASFIITMPKRT